jgi:tellurite resistance protein TehA-like permease
LIAVSPYRDPRVLLSLAMLAAVAVALVLVVNRVAEGTARTVATLAIAAALWIGLMVVLRLARRES